jgi:tetratricopeptide (TPR) repeat protein
MNQILTTLLKKLVTKKNIFIVIVLLLFILIIYLVFNYIRRYYSEKFNEKFVISYIDKKYSLASYYIDEAISLESNNANFWANKGILTVTKIQSNNHIDSTISTKDNESILKSIDCFKNALKLNPNDAIFLQNLAWLYHSQGNYKLSKDFFIKSLVMEERNIVTNISYGIFNIETNHLDEAFYNISLSILYSPDIVDSKFFEDLKTKFPEKTDSIIKENISILENAIYKTNSPILKSRLAKLSLYIGNIDYAEKLFSEVVIELPNLNRPWYYLGFIQELKKDTLKFLNSYTRSLLLDSNDLLPNMQLGNYYSKSQPENSLIYYKKALLSYTLLSSEHYKKGLKIIYNSLMIQNDILPLWLLPYIKPKFDYKLICEKLSNIYKSMGKNNSSKYYRQLSKGMLPLSTIKYKKYWDLDN